MSRALPQLGFLAFSVVSLGGPASVRSQEVGDGSTGLLKWDRERRLATVASSQRRSYVTYVDIDDEEDLSPRLEKVITQVSGHGGTIVLPPGRFRVSKTIDLCGSRRGGSPRGVVLMGAGGPGATSLVWHGAEWTPIVDLPSPWGCQIRNLSIDGRDTAGVIGLRYRGGYERGVNSGKNNVFEHLAIANVNVGIEVGDPLGPDLVGGDFRSISIRHVQIGVRVLGANVTGMTFRNMILRDYEQAGIKLMGLGGRVVRAAETDSVPEDQRVLMDSDHRRELLLSDLPPYARKRMVRGHSRYGHIVGGGGPDITIFDLTGGSPAPKSWMIDTNFCAVRVYTARIEGHGGVLRRTYSGISGRFNDVLMDVCTTAAGQRPGNAIEYHGRGPLFLVGGAYDGDIRLLGQVVVYTLGTRFTTPGSAGFRQLPQTAHSGAHIHQVTPCHVLTVAVPAGEKSIPVRLAGMTTQADANYLTAVTPSFNAGGVWVTDKRPDGFRVHFGTAAGGQASIDVLIRRAPRVTSADGSTYNAIGE